MKSVLRIIQVVPEVGLDWEMSSVHDTGRFQGIGVLVDGLVKWLGRGGPFLLLPKPSDGNRRLTALVAGIDLLPCNLYLVVDDWKSYCLVTVIVAR